MCRITFRLWQFERSLRFVFLFSFMNKSIIIEYFFALIFPFYDHTRLMINMQYWFTVPGMAPRRKTGGLCPGNAACAMHRGCGSAGCVEGSTVGNCAAQSARTLTEIKTPLPAIPPPLPFFWAVYTVDYTHAAYSHRCSCGQAQCR
jgi:hypothetical protein